MKGFTLTELIIVVAIIAILALIASSASFEQPHQEDQDCFYTQTCEER